VVRKVEKNRAFTGEYYENDAGESVQIEVSGTGIKLIKKIKGRDEKVEYRHFGSNDDAIIECIKEADCLKTEGFKPMSHKFLCTYVD